MDGDQWLLVLVRAWWDDGQFRARLLVTASDGRSTSTHAATPDDVARRVLQVLSGPPPPVREHPDARPDPDGEG